MPLFWVLVLILVLIKSPIGTTGKIAVSSHSQVNHVVISEVQIGGGTIDDEFVELLNPTDCLISITGWKLTKKTTGGTESNLVASLSGTIPAHGFFLIAHQTDYDGLVEPDHRYSGASFFIAANNTILLYADQAKTTLVDKVGFAAEGNAVEAEGSPAPNPATHGSVERSNGQDTDNNAVDFTLRLLSDPQNRQSTISSPGNCAAPPIDIQPPPPSVGGATQITIGEARSRPSGQLVLVEGVVLVRPGQLSQTHFYIQDDTGGLQIYSSNKSFPQLTIGNRVKVAGELSEAFNEKRLKIAAPSDIQIVGQGTVSPRREKTGQVGEDDEGELLVLSGEVTETSGDTFFISDGSGSIKIFIREETGIDKPRMQKGDAVTVVGIVSQYQADYRLLPRFQDDLTVGGVEESEAVEGRSTASTVAGRSPRNSDSQVVFGEEAIASSRNGQAAPVRFGTQVIERPYLRSLGWSAISLGAALLLLLPLLIWEKRSGWLRTRLLKRKGSSEN